MEHADKTRTGQTQRRSASPDAAAQRQAAPLVDHRPGALAQRELAQAIQRSPQVIAQRDASNAIRSSSRPQSQRLDSASADATQLKKSPATATEASDIAPRANNSGLPGKLKSGIESLSGMSMDSVKVHYNSAQPAELNALAYAQGSDIHLAPGQEQHLAHEAWHMVQQAQGRVEPTMQLKGGVSINDDTALEQEADIMGAKALSP
jgi:hypothetical protein